MKVGGGAGHLVVTPWRSPHGCSPSPLAAPQKAESEELETQKPQVKLRRTVSEVVRPASTPPIIASAIKDDDDEDRIIAELEVSTAVCGHGKRSPPHSGHPQEELWERSPHNSTVAAIPILTPSVGTCSPAVTVPILSPSSSHPWGCAAQQWLSPFSLHPWRHSVLQWLSPSCPHSHPIYGDIKRSGGCPILTPSMVTRGQRDALPPVVAPPQC